jgi:Flp pilus assembly protein TadG
MRVKMSRKRPRRRPDEGATTVEAAIVFSALLAVIFGIIEFGTAIWQWNTMMLAVQDVGRYAMINNATAADVETQMQNMLPSASVCTLPTPGNMCVSATTTAGTAPDPLTITLTAIYAYDFLGIANSLGISGALTVASQGTFPQN